MQFELSVVQLITICSIINGLVFAVLVLDAQRKDQLQQYTREALEILR